MLKLSSDAVYCGPALFHVFADARRLVGEHLEPTQNRMQKGALPLEDARHVSAQRLRTDEDQPEEERNL